MATLYVDRKVRAEVHTLFNSATIYSPQRFFKKHSTLVVGLDVNIVSEIEQTLGFAQLPAFDKRGNELKDFHRELEGQARHFENWANKPSPDPVQEALNCLDEVHESLNFIASTERLDASAAEARLLCAKASVALEKDRCFSRDTVETIEAASTILTAAVISPQLKQHPRIKSAAIFCGLAVALTKQHGSDAGRQTSTDTADEAPAGIQGAKVYVASDRVTITKGNPATDFWLHGHLTGRPDCKFSAKVFDVGSEHGIEGGRISKLEVSRNGTVILSYDRGWEQMPQSWRDKAVLKEVLAGFPAMKEGDDGLSANTSKGIKPHRGF